ncbi:type IV pilus modification PilV family protein [Hippea maritima]|uniref:Prepilin-type N-terminal cleavage/methylation domain-containing protein n=1 Tax=Hippea maritima (strain ATCC 700847 / DSM 10411 / MH2) TaxID=760142 RepID=F2LWJ1_HIPMA|nr:hypothetical protein [Hippea maritima]AEA34100.1 hypothetical protein Hipma_1134 [Hippea maritima DSM 10411]
MKFKEKGSGFTLIEVVLSIVVFTLGVVGIMVVFYNTLGKTSNPIIRHRAIEVAQSVMDEILSKKFDNDTPNGGGTIPLNEVNIKKEENTNNTDNFDDVDDFDNLSCITGSNGCFDDITAGYKIKVDVKCAKLDNNKVVIAECPTNFKLIRVEVTSNGLDESYILKALKGNF